MKPLKSGLVFSNWLLRVAILLFIVILFFGKIKSFGFSNREYYIDIAIICICNAFIYWWFYVKTWNDSVFWVYNYSVGNL